MSSVSVYNEIIKLGPTRLCDWLTRPNANELPFAAPLARRATMLLYPTLAGAYHDKFRSLSVLQHFLNFAFLEDIVDGNYPEDVQKSAKTAIQFVDAFKGASAGNFDPYKHYQDAMFLPSLRLKALEKVPKELANGVSDCSLDLAPFLREVRASENVAPPPFPILIWAGNISEMNAHK